MEKGEIKLEQMTINQLVDRFAETAIAQDDAVWFIKTRLYNRLYKQLEEIDLELRARGPAARLSLCRLFTHPNMQVRLQAATWSLGVAPTEARKVLEVIRPMKTFPQALDAGMTLIGLDDGTFKPD
jgi:hypothetical protein